MSSLPSSSSLGDASSEVTKGKNISVSEKLDKPVKVVYLSAGEGWSKAKLSLHSHLLSLNSGDMDRLRSRPLLLPRELPREDRDERDIPRVPGRELGGDLLRRPSRERERDFDDVTREASESPCASWASTGIALATAGPSKTPRPKEASLEGLAVPAPHSGSEAPCPGA